MGEVAFNRYIFTKGKGERPNPERIGKTIGGPDYIVIKIKIDSLWAIFNQIALILKQKYYAILAPSNYDPGEYFDLCLFGTLEKEEDE